MLHVPLKFGRNVLVSLGIGVLWIASLGLGLRALLHQEEPSIAPRNFPAQSALFLASDRPTLVLLAQPQSSNSRISAGELARVLSGLDGKIKVYVLFNKREQSADADSWRNIAAIPGVTPVGDEDGGEIRRFTAGSSSEALLYAADGRLLFSGSLPQTTVQADGEIRENPIVSLVKAQPAPQASSSVFALADAHAPATEAVYRK